MNLPKLYISLIILILTVLTSSCLKVQNNGCTRSAPETATDPPSFINSKGAILNGRILAKGQSAAVAFELGTDEQYDKVYDLSVAGDNILHQVNMQISELTSGTTYHYRIRVIGECETVYGEDRVFTTLANNETGIIFNPSVSYGSVQDIDGNVYKTIQAGTQTWMAENLKASRLNDGSPLSYESNNQIWLENSNPAYCWYNNDTWFRQITGNYYNWYAVNTGKLCPVGWHVPSESDWNTFTTYLGETGASGKLRQSEGNLWLYPNTGATNSIGFTALPAGYRNGIMSVMGGNFGGLGEIAYWWTSTESGIVTAKYRSVDYAGNLCGTLSCPGKWPLNNKSFGFNVRCIQNQ